MKIQIFTDEVVVDEGKYDHIFIEAFIPRNPDEKEIVIKGLEKVIGIIQSKF